MATPRGNADFQSAVSRVSNPQALRRLQSFGTGDALPIGNRRYSGLETCATSKDALNRYGSDKVRAVHFHDCIETAKLPSPTGTCVGYGAKTHSEEVVAFT